MNRLQRDDLSVIVEVERDEWYDDGLDHVILDLADPMQASRLDHEHMLCQVLRSNVPGLVDHVENNDLDLPALRELIRTLRDMPAEDRSAFLNVVDDPDVDAAIAGYGDDYVYDEDYELDALEEGALAEELAFYANQLDD